MKSPNMSIRFAAAERVLLKRAAESAGEKQTEFIKNAILLRIQSKQLFVKPKGLAEVLDELFISPYHPAQVSKADAQEIDALIQADRRDELEYRTLGTVKVRSPKRKVHGGRGR